MSSRREVLIRILALLQRKTLLETKYRTLKCLKRHYSTAQSIKNVAVLTEDGAFALFFRPHPGGFEGSRVPTPGNLPSKAKNANAWGSAWWGGGWWERAGRSWNWLMHYLRAEFISKSLFSNHSQINIMYFNCSKVSLILLTKNCNCLDILKKTLHSFDDVRRWIKRAAYNRRNMVTVTGRLIQSGLNTSQTVELR